MDCNASNTSIGAVLLQIQDGKEKVVAYNSYALNPAERSYCTTKRKLLAVVSAIRKIWYYLSSYGSRSITVAAKFQRHQRDICTLAVYTQ